MEGSFTAIVLGVLFVLIVGFMLFGSSAPKPTSGNLVYVQKLNNSDVISHAFPRSTTRDQFQSWIQTNMQGTKALKDFVKANKS